MTNETKKPTHRLVRYYGKGKNAARADLGVAWANEDGSLSIQLNMLDAQHRLHAFPIKETSS